MKSGSVSEICCSTRGLVVNVKKIGAEAAIVSALALTAVGMGAGVANADQPMPSTPGMTWKLDRGHATVVIGIGTVTTGMAVGVADPCGRPHPLRVAPAIGCRRPYGSGCRRQRGDADALANRPVLWIPLGMNRTAPDSSTLPPW